MDISTVLSWVSQNPGGSVALGAALVFVVGALVWNLGVYGGYVLVVVAATLLAWAMGNWLYLWVFLLGMATAFTEIIGKFRDEPLKSFRTREALFYHVFNGLLSVFALYVLLVYGWPVETPLDRIKAIVTAGLGAMLFMRSRLFNVKVANEDISFGPEQFVRVFLQFMEETIGRVRAQARIDVVKDAMDNINPNKVESYTVTMLRSVPTLVGQQLTDLEKEVGTTCKATGDEQNRAYKLGFVLLDRGEDFVRKLFENKDDHPEWLIRAPVPKPPPEGLVARAKVKVGIDKIEEPVAYFAYGRNMLSRQMRRRLNWTEEEAGKAWDQVKWVPAILPNHRLVFGKPLGDEKAEVVATVVRDPAAKVKGVVYWLPPLAMKFCDDRSGPAYKRVTVNVTIPGGGDNGQTEGKTIESWTYKADIAQELPPSPAYLDIMVAGGEEHGLSDDYISALKATTTATT